MTATRTDERVDLEALIEPPTRCEHTNHNRLGWRHHHHGPATHYVRAIHNCENGGPLVYPACAPFVAFVTSMMDTPWMCASCGYMDEGRYMVEVCGPITTPTI